METPSHSITGNNGQDGRVGGAGRGGGKVVLGVSAGLFLVFDKGNGEL